MTINDFLDLSYPFLAYSHFPSPLLSQVGAEVPRGGVLGGFHRRLCSPLVTLEGKTKALRTGGVARPRWLLVMGDFSAQMEDMEAESCKQPGLPFSL